jgi:hypothetical protein
LTVSREAAQGTGVEQGSRSRLQKQGELRARMLISRQIRGASARTREL